MAGAAGRRRDLPAGSARAPSSSSTGTPFALPGYHAPTYPAERKGYGGVALLFARRLRDALVRGFGVAEFDHEGRYLEARFGDLTVVSLYLPSGSAGPERQASKFRFLRKFLPHLAALRRRRRPYIFCGDWNIAHRDIDLKNWRANQKNSGFLPEERAWLDQLFDERRLRRRLPQRQRRARAVHLVVEPRPGLGEERRLAHRLPGHEPGLAGARARGADLSKRRFSDHAPLIMDYDLERGGRSRRPAAGARRCRSTRSRACWRCCCSAFRPGCRSTLVFSTLSAWLRQARHRARDHRHVRLGRHRLLAQVPLGAARRPRAAAAADGLARPAPQLDAAGAGRHRARAARPVATPTRPPA